MGKTKNNQAFASNEKSIYFLLFVVTVFFVVLVYHLWNLDINIPLYSEADAMGMLIQIWKFIRQANPLVADDYCTYPYYTTDVPLITTTYLSNLFYYCIARITKSVGATSTIYYILTFPLSACSMYYSMRDQGLSRESSFVGGIIYAFIPGHLFRNISQITVGAAWILPVACLSPLYILNNNLHTGEEKEGGKNSFFATLDKKKIVVIVIGLVGVAMLNPYYAFYMSLLIIGSAILATIRQQNWRPIADLVLIGGVLIIYYVIASLPSVFLQKDGFDTGFVTMHNASDSETFALKLIQLFLPIPNHRIPIFASIADKYASTYSMTFESRFSSLGFLLSLALAIGIIIVLTGKRNAENSLITNVSVLNLMGILIANIGGLSAFIGMFFSLPRCYNRFSFIIGAYATIALGCLYDSFYLKGKINSFVRFGIGMLIVCFSIMDQSSSDIDISKSEADYMENHYHEMDRFVSDIEKMENNDAKVLVYPIPEDWSKYYYPQAELEMHSHTARWTDQYGLNRYTSAHELEDELKLFAACGGNGIVLYKRAYSESTLENLNSRLEKNLGNNRIESENGDWIFYSMDKYIEEFNKVYESDQIETLRSIVIDKNPVYFMGTDLKMYGEGPRANGYFDYGLSEIEDGFTWTDGNEAKFEAYLLDSELMPVSRKVEVIINVVGTNGNQTVQIISDDERVYDSCISGEETIRFECVPKDGRIDYRIILPNAVEPNSLDYTNLDSRKLALAIDSIEIL